MLPLTRTVKRLQTRENAHTKYTQERLVTK